MNSTYYLLQTCDFKCVKQTRWTNIPWRWWNNLNNCCKFVLLMFILLIIAIFWYQMPIYWSKWSSFLQVYKLQIIYSIIKPPKTRNCQLLKILYYNEIKTIYISTKQKSCYKNNIVGVNLIYLFKKIILFL